MSVNNTIYQNRILAIGDIHGGYKGMIQALERASFNPQKDTLIVLGDVCDGWDEVYEVIDYLSKLPHCIYIIGNHDQWFIEWLNKGTHPCSWLQGGEGTLKSYSIHADKPYIPDRGAFKSFITFYDIPESHRNFLQKGQYYLELQKADSKYLFVHGGYNRHYPITDEVHNCPEVVLIWDRDFIHSARSFTETEGQKFKLNGDYTNVFIGHTTTSFWKYSRKYLEKHNLPLDLQGKPILTPMFAGPVIDLDTGGGFEGFITVMDIESKEYWQSDKVSELYPNFRGRN